MSQIITLEVGPEPMIMTAHETMLTRSDYFAKYLENLKEGVQNKVKLPHDVPVDILRILCSCTPATCSKETPATEIAASTIIGTLRE